MRDKKKRVAGGAPATQVQRVQHGKASDVQAEYSTNGADLSSKYDEAMQDAENVMVEASEIEAERLAEEAADRRFERHGLSYLYSRPSKQWIIQNIIGAGDLAMVYGPPASGKTFVLIDLIFSACLGRRFARRFDVVKPLNVCYCAGEGHGGLPDRFRAAGHFYGVGEGEMPRFDYVERLPALFYTDNDSEYLATSDHFIAEFTQDLENGIPTPDVLILDTLHGASAGAEENSAKDMGLVLRRVKRIRDALDCAVILVHHTNKNGSSERGSSAMRGDLDLMIECKPEGKKFRMSRGKLKDGDQWESQTYDLVAAGADIDSVRVWWDEPEASENSRGKLADKILAVLQSRPENSFTTKSLAEAVAATARNVNNSLSSLIDKGFVDRRLQDESKQSSSRNPWVYQFKDIS